MTSRTLSEEYATHSCHTGHSFPCLDAWKIATTLPLARSPFSTAFCLEVCDLHRLQFSTRHIYCNTYANILVLLRWYVDCFHASIAQSLFGCHPILIN